MPGFEKGELVDGRYEIQSVLGSGGMGTVYRATQLNLDRTVAIKVPSDKVLDNPEFTKRFLREAHMCAQVAHPHVVSIFDVHDDPQAPYIVMEYVDGMPLHHYLTEQSTSLFVSDLLDIVGQVCGGLDAAHNKGIIHRDIKPANIVITSTDRQVKLMDFGIARALDQTSITMAGTMMGTPYYMAPEQIQGGELTGAADIYSLGCVVFRLLSGRHVFEGEVPTLIYKHVSVPPPALTETNPNLPEEVDAIVRKALSKKAIQRQSTCMEFFRELSKALRPVSHLPYSQIFPSAGDGPFSTGRTHRAPTPPSPDAEPPVPPSGQAPLPDHTDISAMTPTGSEDETVASQTPPHQATGRHKAWIAVMIICLGAVGAVAFWLANRPADTPDDGTPIAQPTPVPTAAPTGAPDPSPAPSGLAVLPDAARIILLRRPESETMVRGEHLLVTWSAMPEPSALAPYAYRVELLGPDGIDERHVTRTGRFAHRLSETGAYTLRIRNAREKPRMEPVQIQIEVNEKP